MRRWSGAYFCKQTAVTTDVAELATTRVDLHRFHIAITAAIASGELTDKSWADYRNHRLRTIFVPADNPTPTRRRVAAYRAAKRVQPFIDIHLTVHAA